MKNYYELTDAQQERAVAESLRRIVQAISVGGLTFNDVANGNHLQARIDVVFETAGEDPEVAKKMIMTSCGRELLKIARMCAKDAIYVENDTVIAIDAL